MTQSLGENVEARLRNSTPVNIYLNLIFDIETSWNLWKVNFALFLSTVSANVSRTENKWKLSPKYETEFRCVNAE
jgi:hypothetical protein